MKRAIKNVMMLLAALFIAACSSDEDEFAGEGLTGKWDLIEVQNGPSGMCQDGYSTKYQSKTVVIQIQGSNTIEFAYSDGKTESMPLKLEDASAYQSNLPVLTIGGVPFGYEVTSTRLKLHYFGAYFCDHIPATFIFKRTRD